jgi:hypothetical protein
MGMKVVDVRKFGWDGIEYVGRGRGSKLGNRFVIGRDGNRSEVIEKFRKWLWVEVRKGEGVVWDELVRLCGKVRSGEEVVLGCWCGERGCHGEVIVRCVEWMVREGKDL